MKKNVGQGIQSVTAGDWNFGNVANVFDEHITKSIPGYSEAHDIIIKLSDYFVSNNDTCIDIGCSTGSLLNKLATHHSQKNAKFIGIDNQISMIQTAQSRTHDERVEYIHGELLDQNFHCSFLISAFTIQFVPQKIRQNLINKIYADLEWGAGFCFFEKVKGCDARFQEILTGVHWEWKSDMGFSDAEILQKARSIKKIMDPFSHDGNISMLRRAGFSDIETVWKWGPFEGLLAIK